MADAGVALAQEPSARELEVRDTYLDPLFEGLGLVPPFDAPATLGWRDPIEDPTLPYGVLVLVYKLVVAVFIIGAARVAYRSMKRGRPGSGIEAPSGHGPNEWTPGTSRPPERYVRR
jgi:hypothetical protein